MINSTNFQDYWYFSRKYLQFERVSNLCGGLLGKNDEVSEEARTALRLFDKDRIACQNKIGELDLPSYARCDVCAGECCDKSSEQYFSPIDFWLAKYTSDHAPNYAEQPVKPLHHYFKARVASLPRRLYPSVKIKNEPPLDMPMEKCFHLGERGCKLPHVERPIKCLIYTCPRLKKSMDHGTRLAYREAIKTLYLISLKTFNVLKVEAGLPRYYGIASIFFTL